MGDYRNDLGLALTVLAAISAAIGWLIRNVWNLSGKVSQAEEAMKRLDKLPCGMQENRLRALEDSDRRNSDAMIAVRDALNDLKVKLDKQETRREEQQRAMYATLNTFADKLGTVGEHVSRISGVMDARKER